MKRIFTLLFTCCTIFAMANNATISNFTYLSGTNQLQFDVSWDNSWRNTSVMGATQNYDGVWVFAKFRASCSKDSISPSDYHHVWLDTTIGNHVVPAGFTGKVGTTAVGGNNRGMGLFLYRSTDGTGSVNLTGVKLKWDAAAQGVIGTDWDIQLFVVEMVYIPQASYYFGDKASGNNYYAGVTGDPFLVQNETDLIPGVNNVTSGGLYDPLGAGTIVSVASSFPKAVDPFWVMKYEVTQGQYCDFLNCLSRANQHLCAPNCSANIELGLTTVPSSYRNAFAWNNFQFGNRNGIRITGPSDTTSSATIDPSRPVTFVCDLNPLDAGNSNDDGQTVACNFLSPFLLFRYLDWAALRPMNEFEFEKTCRGPLNIPAPYQFPGLNVWGSSTMQNSGSGLTNPGTPSEALTTVANGNGLVVSGITYNTSGAGPRRVGITQTAGSTRQQGGVSYYGASDMEGNVSEICIRVVGGSAPSYTRNSHGDGDLSTLFTIAHQWPSSFSYNSAGLIMRGGNWSQANGISGRPYYSSASYAIDCQTQNCATGIDPQATQSQGTAYTFQAAQLALTGGRGVRQAQ